MKLNVFCLIFIFSQAIIRVAQPCTLRYCVTASRVNIRAWPCGSIIGSGYRNRCFSHRGGERRCYLRHLRRYVPYVPIQFGSRVAWAARNLMRLDKNCPPPPAPPVNQHNPCGNFIVSRAGWGARAPKHITGLSTPVRTVIIHHTVTGRCYTGDQCKAKMRGMQNYHMNTRRWSDIGYNFAIGDDNKAYEGRKWTRRGAHAGGCNGLSIGIALIGNFDTARPTASMIQLAKNLINCGINKGYIVPWYRLSILGHRDVCSTACPGRYMYSVIRHWPGFRRTVPCRC